MSIDSVNFSNINTVSSKTALKPTFTSNSEETENGNNKTALLLTGLAALGVAGIYLATRKKPPEANNATDKTQEMANEQTKKVLDKLPSRKDILESLGLEFDDNKRLIIKAKDADGKDYEKLYNGTFSYTARKGVNIEEEISNGRVVSRIMTTEKDVDNPIKKSYSYYGDFSTQLKSIDTFKENHVFHTFANQKALQQYRVSLNYKPKTEAEINALKAKGINYEVVEEASDWGQYGSRTNLKEIYTYPEDYPIATKEIYYGNRKWTSNDGKEITLTFKEPQALRNSHYKTDMFTIKARDNGFICDDMDYNYTNIESTLSPLPFNLQSTKAYKEIKAAINEEFNENILHEIRYGRKRKQSKY